ncbi:hypothetical protein FKM82_031047 [Ascaphus truei]
MEPFDMWGDYLGLNALVKRLAREERRAAVLRCGGETESAAGESAPVAPPCRGGDGRLAELLRVPWSFPDEVETPLPAPAQAEAAPAEPTQLCSFCKHNGESKRVYGGHCLKDGQGQVQCPILRNYVCPQCGATGIRAHTRRFCPMTEKGYASVYQGTLRNSAGRKGKKGERPRAKDRATSPPQPPEDTMC